MKKGSMVMGVLLAVLSFAGVAESADNSSVPQGKEGSSLSGTPSFFEGIWSGVFTLGLAGNVQQETTITIGKKGPKGYNKTTYAYGWGQYGSGGNVPPGSFVVYGREEDGFFRFGWKDKSGSKRTVKMEKVKDDVAKVKLDQEGAGTSSQSRPFYEAFFKRQ